MPIEEGQSAPAFTLPNQYGEPVALESLRGKYIILYFYPKDDTPGCTKEACGFRDNILQFEEMDAVILGVSPDSAESHVRFIDKFKLPFQLLCDPTKKVMERYGAWGEKILYGRKTVGTIRSTVVITPDGNVAKHWKKVPKAADHPDKVLAYLKTVINSEG